MRIESRLPRPRRRLPLVTLAASCLAAWSVALSPGRAEAGSLVIPAWSFARGNARVYADPTQYADAGPVVGSGREQPWGSRVEYDIDIPVTGQYTLQVCYAAAEARPVEVFLDNENLVKCCTGVTFGAASSGQPAKRTWNRSGAKWERVCNYRSVKPLKLSITKGVHTVTFARRGPLPHLVALRLDTPEEFPEGWKPPRYKVRDLDSIPAAYRKTFLSAGVAGVAALPPPLENTAGAKVAGSLTIPACTFDRGNARIYANPDRCADAGPLAGGGPPSSGESVVEYDIDVPVTGRYTFWIHYAAAEARPVDVFLDGRNLGKSCMGVSFDSARFERPVRTSWTSRSAKWEGLYDYNKGSPLEIPVAKGKHTLKLARPGPLPHLAALRLDTPTAFPEDWEQPERKVDLGRVPPRYRSVFLPPGAVNVAALRLAVQDAMTTYGSRYPDGEKHLKQLAELEKKQRAAEGGPAEERQKIERALQALRRRVMLAHPLLSFDKLLFLKRPAGGYGHTYADQAANDMGGNLCLLSPAAPDGKVTKLVPELDGGLFGRFDLSFDAKKVVFSYKKKDEAFHLYEIEIDPSTGLKVPGSLRQLTFGGQEEAEALRCQVNGGHRHFHDIDPCYLPDGRIMFASTRAMRIVFCAPGAAVTTLYVMDADGENLRRLSESPVNETAPAVLDDGRVIYTRWEYIDKGLGNGGGLWAVRPDGSGVDHVYKNNTVWPAGLSDARSVPGTRQIVAAGGGHHFAAVGPVVLVDARRSRRTPEALTNITPEIGYPPSMGYPTTQFGSFMEPYPLSEKLFLVSHNPVSNRREPVHYGIYVLDAWGNRAKLCQDADLSCFEPVPLRPRHKPPRVAPFDAASQAVADEGAAVDGKTASLLIQDIYQGMTGIERGRVKYVRVMGALPWPWDQHGISWRLGLHADPHRKKVYGVAKVGEDGSAYFTVPAEENLFFQALDENFMALQQMPTFINLMPGESRACIGCHELRRKAPSVIAARPQALDHPPQTLAPQPGDAGPRMVDYAADVQPILDRHCVGCHGGQQPKGRLDLTGAPTQKWNRSHENLVGMGLVSYRDCRYGSSHFRATPPLTHGSHRSKLVEQIRRDPCRANLTREEFIRIVTWIDANVPYYGTYRGKRNLQDKDDPDFRALPLVKE